MKESKLISNKMGMSRCVNNPLLTIKDVRPSRENFVVKGIFNCGVTKFKEEYILLCRVSEAVASENEDEIIIPLITDKTGESKFDILCIKKSEHPQLNFNDSRTVTKGRDGNSNVVYLTTFSHLRLARSKDGIHFTLDDKPTIMPNAREEGWGMEDPRITKIGQIYYINYTAVSANGAATALISTEDFIEYTRHGIIFLPENKDVTIFPEKINGKYYAFNRPVPKAIGTPDIWIGESQDLLHWGSYRHFYGVSESSWENGRIGGGAPPVKTERGWIKIYHAADKNNRYCLGAFLLDLNDPARIIAKSESPLLEPEMEYEVNGFFGNVVFTCGCILEGNNIKIYYGAADDSICLSEISLQNVFRHLGV